MKAIIVDDEPIMLQSFVRQSKNIDCLKVIGTFQSSADAEIFAKDNPVDLAVLDIKMPEISGIELAKRLRTIRPDILIVFISAYDEFIKESNEVNADYYIVKPYTHQILQQMAERMDLIAQRQKKDIYVQMFGRFVVFKCDQPVPLKGKAKEILALVASRGGKEISNEEIYSTIWEDRPYSNELMKVYYNALKRLKTTLEAAGISEILISTSRGQIFNRKAVDCDYYSWMDQNSGKGERFEGEFLSEYSWGEYILPYILNNNIMD